MSRLLATALLLVLCFAVYDSFAGETQMFLNPDGPCPNLNGVYWEFQNHQAWTITGAGTGNQPTLGVFVVIHRCFTSFANCDAVRATYNAILPGSMNVGSPAVAVFSQGHWETACVQVH